MCPSIYLYIYTAYIWYVALSMELLWRPSITWDIRHRRASTSYMIVGEEAIQLASVVQLHSAVISESPIGSWASMLSTFLTKVPSWERGTIGVLYCEAASALDSIVLVNRCLLALISIPSSNTHAPNVTCSLNPLNHLLARYHLMEP